ncbi:hypothetical protein K437DRAFT_99667 [Tilletiaria anomala UBC 951]|uniref:Uncharacterized protein n=1 Tax=Tilletiaria anomala (strain ATCC 24038 / CBS 436.72 / UBC 951) TaxID=1037660 RepID=A0A066W0W7_TILAU|nr:uncharacterized protein K437DRAFT_99667 [Tilletiaria anomala UBC 951]KDN47336.1 hypothetical protein K437DRAFT_99667 [Tilletiaria anomala UBC 951]
MASLELQRQRRTLLPPPSNHFPLIISHPSSLHPRNNVSISNSSPCKANSQATELSSRRPSAAGRAQQAEGCFMVRLRTLRDSTCCDVGLIRIHIQICKVQSTVFMLSSHSFARMAIPCRFGSLSSSMFKTTSALSTGQNQSRLSINKVRRVTPGEAEAPFRKRCHGWVNNGVQTVIAEGSLDGMHGLITVVSCLLKTHLALKEAHVRTFAPLIRAWPPKDSARS